MQVKHSPDGKYVVFFCVVFDFFFVCMMVYLCVWACCLVVLFVCLFLMMLGHIQKISFYFLIWVLIPYQESSLWSATCWTEFYNVFVYGLGYFLLSINLFIPSLYNFRVSIFCVIGLTFPVDCNNQFQKSRLRNEKKINITLQNLRFFLQDVGSLWSIILQDFR